MIKIPFDELKAKQRARRDAFPEEMGLRVHRAISWLGRANHEQSDPDAAFIFLWIAFNAAYAGEASQAETYPLTERQSFRELLDQFIGLDHDKHLERVICKSFHGPVRKLMSNRFIFQPFWRAQSGMCASPDWENQFVGAARCFTRAMREKDTAQALGMVFDRLYMLRNQMVHGGTTWNSSVNRDQVNDGAEILASLLPVMIDLMLENPDKDWGTPFYPVINPIVMPANSTKPRMS